MESLTSLLTNPDQAFALIQRQDSEEILVLTGRAVQYDQLAAIARKQGADPSGRPRHDSLSLVPFSQIREKGYVARCEGEQIRSLLVEEEHWIHTRDLLDCLPDLPVHLQTPVHYSTSEEEYARMIEAIIVDEIGRGEGANFVIPREGQGQIADFSPALAVSIFRRLVQGDYGTYWKFVFWDTESCFIGSTPERHLEVRAGRVKMNPISGTFRKTKSYECRRHFKEELLGFLRDKKEINELFMVVDEELKMMARMCDSGGSIIGPLLKEMSRLIHTEYLLSGSSDKDIIDLFIDSMYAATVVGSPVENACRIIEKYSTHSRRYYGSALLLMGRDEDGRDFLDSPITIRTLETNRAGQFHFSVGATLVRDSVPQEEVAETRAKGAAVLACLDEKPKSAGPRLLPLLANDDEIAEELVQRNQNLSTFWFFRQEKRAGVVPAKQGHLTLIHNNDDFIYMLSHILRAQGHTTFVVPWEKYDAHHDHGDITLLGPGPGDPMAEDAQKMTVNRRICAELIQARKPSLFVCLGHQILCHCLGFPLQRLAQPMQGIQVSINYFGREERVGFYNTYVGQYLPGKGEVEACCLPDGRGLAALRGPHFASFQFHPESLLSTNGAALLEESVQRLLP